MDVTNPSLDESRGGRASAGIQNRNLLVQLRYVIDRILSRPAAKDYRTPRREKTQITISRCLGVRRDDLNTGLHEVCPVPDAFRISFSYDENDRRVIGERSLRQSINPAVFDETLPANGIDVDD